MAINILNDVVNIKYFKILDKRNFYINEKWLSHLQRLKTVKISLALPTGFTAVNQMFMMALAMVAIASMLELKV